MDLLPCAFVVDLEPAIILMVIIGLVLYTRIHPYTEVSFRRPLNDNAFVNIVTYDKDQKLSVHAVATPTHNRDSDFFLNLTLIHPNTALPWIVNVVTLF